ncbi:MAG: hypothetical protein ABEH81_01070 [Halopenitus sp.]
MRKLEIGGRTYRVTGDPDMRIVKHVQEMEIEMMREYLDDETILQIDSAEEDELTNDLLGDADIEDFKSMLWERSVQQPLQTICLATNEMVTMDDVDSMKAMEFKELKEVSEEELGGSASDFIEELGIGISSQMSEMENQLQTGQTESESDQQSSESETSNEQFKAGEVTRQ